MILCIKNDFAKIRVSAENSKYLRLFFHNFFCENMAV